MKVQLNWQFVADPEGPEDGFIIYRKKSGSGQVELARVPPATLTYTDDEVEEGTTYSYIVQSYNTAGHSGGSNEVVIAVTVKIPPTPTNLVARIIQ